jgi:hypothetical protein
MPRNLWRVPLVLLAVSVLAPASFISTLPQPEYVYVEPTPEPGPKLKYTIGREIRVYPLRPEKPPPSALAFLLIGFPAATIFFLLIPFWQWLALRFRLMDDRAVYLTASPGTESSNRPRRRYKPAP